MITTKKTLAVMARIVRERGWIAPSVTHEVLSQPTWWLAGTATPVTIQAALELALRELHGADALPLAAYGLQQVLPCLARAAGESLALWEATPGRRSDEVLTLLDGALAVAEGRPVPGVPRIKHPASLRDVKGRLSLQVFDRTVTLDGEVIGTIKRDSAQTLKRGFASVQTFYVVLATVEGRTIDVSAADLASITHWVAVKISGILKDALAKRGLP